MQFVEMGYGQYRLNQINLKVDSKCKVLNQIQQKMHLNYIIILSLRYVITQLDNKILRTQKQKMSTTFKIIQNHIQNSRVSPKRSVVLSSSKHLSPSSRGKYSDDGSQSLQQEQVLKLQIKQLQRENKFLKKKIAQLTQQLNGQQKQSKKKINLGKGAHKQDADPVHLTVDFFFKEINNLLNSVTDLFKVQFTNDELKEFSAKFSSKQQTLAANRRYVVFKKSILTKKLQKITLENQQKRYASLLQIFTEYYTAKQECDKYIRQLMDELSQRVLHLNKMILQNATKKKNSLKGSSVKSHYCFDELNEKNLQLPWSIKAMSPPSTLNIIDTSSLSKIEEKIFKLKD